MSSQFQHIQLTEHAQEFFFEAMLRGYASDVVPTKVLGMPGFKEIEYNKGSWRCIDRWAVRPDSNRSAGTTNIWYCDMPIWTMSYQGWYDEGVIWLLRAALKSNYDHKFFSGGRGAGHFKKENLEYSNRCRGSFLDFSGREKICRTITGEVLGYHEYLGMALLP